MKLGFIIGAVIATWMTLNYPSEMRNVLAQVQTVMSEGFGSLAKR